ncbi:unnamed protein product [Amoebophrya sp. A120]|nr:unnamed protein product [Amoebophrya sp. A120]|eukprot:GSA120T00000431001.1
MPYCKTARIYVRKSSMRNFVLIWGGGIFPFNKPLRVFSSKATTVGVSRLAFHGEDTMALTSPSTSEIWVYRYRFAEWSRFAVLKEHADVVADFEFNRFGWLVSCGHDRCAYVWRRAPPYGGGMTTTIHSSSTSSAANSDELALVQAGSTSEDHHDPRNIDSRGDHHQLYYPVPNEEHVYQPELVQMDVEFGCVCARWSPDASRFAVATVAGECVVCTRRQERSGDVWSAWRISLQQPSSSVPLRSGGSMSSYFSFSQQQQQGAHGPHPITALAWCGNLFLCVGGADKSARVYSTFAGRDASSVGVKNHSASAGTSSESKTKAGGATGHQNQGGNKNSGATSTNNRPANPGEADVLFPELEAAAADKMDVDDDGCLSPPEEWATGAGGGATSSRGTEHENQKNVKAVGQEREQSNEQVGPTPSSSTPAAPPPAQPETPPQLAPPFGTCVLEAGNAHSWVTCATFQQKAMLLAVCRQDSSITITNMVTREEHIINYTGYPLSCVAFLAPNILIACGFDYVPVFFYFDEADETGPGSWYCGGYLVAEQVLSQQPMAGPSKLKLPGLFGSAVLEESEVERMNRGLKNSRGEDEDDNDLLLANRRKCTTPMEEQGTTKDSLAVPAQWIYQKPVGDIRNGVVGFVPQKNSESNKRKNNDNPALLSLSASPEKNNGNNTSNSSVAQNKSSSTSAAPRVSLQLDDKSWIRGGTTTTTSGPHDAAQGAAHDGGFTRITNSRNKSNSVGGIRDETGEDHGGSIMQQAIRRSLIGGGSRRGSSSAAAGQPHEHLRTDHERMAGEAVASSSGQMNSGGKILNPTGGGGNSQRPAASDRFLQSASADHRPVEPRQPTAAPATSIRDRLPRLRRQAGQPKSWMMPKNPALAETLNKLRHTKRVSDLRILRAPHRFATCGLDGKVLQWDLSNFNIPE